MKVNTISSYPSLEFSRHELCFRLALYDLLDLFVHRSQLLLLLVYLDFMFLYFSVYAFEVDRVVDFLDLGCLVPLSE